MSDTFGAIGTVDLPSHLNLATLRESVIALRGAWGLN